MTNTNKINSANSGFSTVGILVAIVIFAVVVLIGLFIWRSQGTQQTANNASTQEQEQDPSEGGKYLVIEEWGVRLPLADNIGNAYYTYRSGDPEEFIDLFDEGFDSLSNANGIPCGGGNEYNMYSISRVRAQDLKVAQEGPGPQFVKFPFSDDYRFGGLGQHQAPPFCANLNPDPYGKYEEDADIAAIADAKERAFDEAFEKLEPAN